MTILLPLRNLNPHIKDSPEEVEEISDNEDLNHTEDTPTGQNSPAETISNRLSARDPNVREKRFRYSTRNKRRNYHKLYHKGFVKVIRATALINGYNEPYIYKEAIDSPERE